MVRPYPGTFYRDPVSIPGFCPTPRGLPYYNPCQGEEQEYPITVGLIATWLRTGESLQYVFKPSHKPECICHDAPTPSMEGVPPGGITLLSDHPGTPLAENPKQLYVVVQVNGIDNAIRIWRRFDDTHAYFKYAKIITSRPLLRLRPIARYLWRLLRLAGSLASKHFAATVQDTNFANLPGFTKRVQGSYRLGLVHYVRCRCLGCGVLTARRSPAYDVLLCINCMSDARRPGIRHIPKTQAKTHLPRNTHDAVSSLPCVNMFGYRQLVPYAEVLELRRAANCIFIPPNISLQRKLLRYGPVVPCPRRFSNDLLPVTGFPSIRTSCILHPRDGSWGDALYE